MNKQKNLLLFPFVAIMLLFVLFILWYVPTFSSLRFQLQDVGKSLETSQGRERKQQKEYDEAAAAIPETESDISRVLPLAEAAQKEVDELKAQRKKLRNEKKELESLLDSKQNQEVKDHD